MKGGFRDIRTSGATAVSPTRSTAMLNLLEASVCCVTLLVMGGFVTEAGSPETTKPGDSGGEKGPTFRGFAIRYQVKDVERSAAFYTQHLGFKLDQQSTPAFGKVSNGNLTLLLSG